MIRITSLCGLFLCATAMGCKPTTGFCTDIGCESGLIVNVQGAPSGPMTIDVSAPGFETQTRQCPAGVPCSGLHFPGFTPPSATITVTTGDRSSTTQVTLTRRDVKPNGPACEPTCNQPLVTVAPPAPPA